MNSSLKVVRLEVKKKAVRRAKGPVKDCLYFNIVTAMNL